MKLTIQSDPKFVMHLFRAFLEPVYQALESATPSMAELMEQRGWDKTPQLFSHIVRAEVKTFLHGRACPVEYDDESRVINMASVAMEGLAATIDGIAFKILKGEVLRPAQSLPRANWYQQSISNLFVGDEIPELKNLVILWDCDERGTGLHLYLACPKDAAGNCYWQVMIPPPAEWMIVDMPLGGSDLGGGDLDIGRKDDSDEQTGEQNK